MCEILFKGFHKNENGKQKVFVNGEWIKGEWVEGNIIGDSVIVPRGQTFEIEGNTIYGCDLTAYEVIPETVGQYTGLTDKNGTKIFEGDVIRCKYTNAIKNEHIQTVVFYRGKFMAKFLDTCAYTELFDGSKHFDFDKSAYITEMKIIGNIHDNPELLEGVQNG